MQLKGLAKAYGEYKGTAFNPRAFVEAFAESIQPETLEHTEAGDRKEKRKMGKGYFAGIDSGSTSTDVVILNKDHEIETSIILPSRIRMILSMD